MGVVVLGPLPASVVEAFRVDLVGQGYRPTGADAVVVVMRDLNRWLSGEGLTPGQLTESGLEQFAAVRRAAGCRRYLSVRNLGSVVSFLRREGLVPPAAVPSQTPVTNMIDAYRLWLVRERGLAARTVARYEKTATRLLSEHASEVDDWDITALTAARVRAFVLSDCGGLGLGSAKTRIGEVRAVLKFLYLSGYTPTALAGAVPSVAGWRGGSLPRSVSPDVVAALLASCDRSRPTGKRDFAILTVLARLGLRAAEVADLELDDIDWRAAELVVRGKSRQADRLPIPADVGEALADYISSGRPPIEGRAVFVRCRAPLTAIHYTTPSTVVRQACRRIGIPELRAHRLRHSLAAETLRQGGSLVEISQLLRHRDLATTAMYAKVDRENLRSLAQPWPGAR